MTPSPPTARIPEPRHRQRCHPCDCDCANSDAGPAFDVAEDLDDVVEPRRLPLPIRRYTLADLFVWAVTGGLGGAAVAIAIYLIWYGARMAEQLNTTAAGGVPT